MALSEETSSLSTKFELDSLSPPRNSQLAAGIRIKRRYYPISKTPLCLSGFQRPQIKRKISSNSGSVSPKSLPKSSILPSPIYEPPERLPPHELMACQSGSSGCISSCPCKSAFSKIPCVQMGRCDLPVQGHALWSNHSSGSVPRPYEPSSKIVEGERYKLHCLPGRLGDMGSLQGDMSTKRKRNLSSPKNIRIPYQRRKICANPQSVNYLAGRSLEREHPEYEASFRKNRKNFLFSRSPLFKQEGLPGRVGKSTRPHGVCRSGFSDSNLEEKTSGPNPEKLARHSPHYKTQDSSRRSFSPSLVVSSQKSRSLVLLPQNSNKLEDMDRRLRLWMGWPYRGRKLGSWRLGPSSLRIPHKCPGNKSSGHGPEEPVSSFRNFNKSSLRQRHHSPGPEPFWFDKFPRSDFFGTRSHGNLQGEGITLGNASHPWTPECLGRCPLAQLSDAGRVGDPPTGLDSDNFPFSAPGSGPNGHSFQSCSGNLRIPVSSPESLPGRCLDDRLEPLELDLSVPTSLSAVEGFSKPVDLPWKCHTNRQVSTSPSHSSNSFPVDSGPQAEISSSTTGEGGNDEGWPTRICALDRLSFLRKWLTPHYGEKVTDKLLGCCRPSSILQQQVAWKAFQDWISYSNPEVINVSTLLSFLIYLREVRNLETSTINNYKASISLPLRAVLHIDFNSWEFKKLSDALFIDKPPKRPHVPSWDLDKVLQLLESDKFAKVEDCFQALRKCVFLTALACGNRVSELAAFQRTGIKFSKPPQVTRVPVKPGFLYKNQRLGRCPPNVSVVPLLEGPTSICPVLALENYLRLSSHPRGQLFCHTRTNSPLKASSISRLLCGIIEEAQPGCFPKGHDLRKVATSLAWVRGLETSEITQRAFWKSSSTFIERYLSRVNNSRAVALNTC